LRSGLSLFPRLHEYERQELRCNCIDTEEELRRLKLLLTCRREGLDPTKYTYVNSELNCKDVMGDY